VSDLKVKRIESTDPRLGRHVVHDERSRAFGLTPAVDKATWRTKSIRIYDPVPNPNQVLGDCTGCAKSMMMNAAGNRVTGVVLNLKDADRIYSLATTLDPFPGSYPPDDTGSSGLGAAKAAVKLGIGGAYSWIFNGADGVVQAVMAGHVVNVGTRWDERMFDQDAHGFVTPGGAVAGGHEWTIHGYDLTKDALRGRCWWGDFRDFWIKRTHLDELLADDGDAHVQERTKS
jgi:hypothetical protein